MNLASANFEKKIFFIVFISVFFSISCLFQGPFVALGLFALFLVLLLSLKNFTTIFYAIFIWSMIAGALSNFTILGKHTLVSYIDKILILILGVKILLNLKKLENDSSVVKLTLAMLIFAFFALVSTITNNSSYLALAGFLYIYLKFFIIFVSAIIFLNRGDIKKIILFMLLFEILQFVVANTQFLSFGKYNVLIGPEIGLREDSACALFGYYGAHILGHFSIIMLILSAGLGIFTNEKKWLFFSIISLYAFVVSFTEHDYIFLFLYFLILLRIFLKQRISGPFRLVLFFCAIASICFSAYYTYTIDIGPSKRYAAYLNNPQKIKGSGKVQSLLLVKELVFREPVAAMVGIGPGNFSSGIAGKTQGEYYMKYIEFRVRNIESTLDYWWSSFSSLLSETGIVGYSLYMYLFLMIFLKILKCYRSKMPQDNFDKGVSFAAFNTLFFLLFLSFVSNAFEWLAITFPSAIVCAYAWENSSISNVKLTRAK